MIKRRFFKQEHGDRDGASDDSSSSSSSSSDSESPPQNEDDDLEDEVEELDEAKERPLSPSSGSGYASEDSSGNEVGVDSSGSGYASEDSSGNEVGVDSSGLPINEEESSEGGNVHHKDERLFSEVHVEETERPSKAVANSSSPKDSIPDLDGCILKCKSVFKCKLCPRIVCLSESTVRAHLNSKRHARSKKLLGEGRLKLMLNSNGKIEEEQETHAERHARTVALAQEKDAPKKMDKGRKRLRKRRKKQNLHDASGDVSEESIKKPTKQRKVED